MSFEPEPGALLADKYRLERRIGKGGMGQVWTAIDVKLDRAVAVKFIDPTLMTHERVRARFEREAKMSARLESQHIVRIYDHGIEDEAPYFVMERLEGEDLAELLARHGRLTLNAAAHLLVHAAKGVQYAHDQGVVHRDLKPRNLYVARVGGEETVKILDFGVAKADWSKAGDTKTGDLVGSPHYMSPEQVHGARKVDHRTDLWSLAVILFRCLTGKRPFEGEGMGEVIVAICTDDPLVASTLRPDLPPEADRFFGKALARDPERRFQSAREMSEAFLDAISMSDSSLSLSVSWLSSEAAASARAQALTPGLVAEDGEETSQTPTSSQLAGAQEPPRRAPQETATPADSPLPAPAPAMPPQPVGAPRSDMEVTPLGLGPLPGPPSAGTGQPAVTPSSPDVLPPPASTSSPSAATSQPGVGQEISYDSVGSPSIGTLASVQQSLAPATPRRSRRLLVGVTAAMAVVVLVVVVAFIATGADGPGETAAAAAPPSAAETNDNEAPDVAPAPADSAAEPEAEADATTEATAESAPPASATAEPEAAATSEATAAPDETAKPSTARRPRPRPQPRRPPPEEPRTDARERLGY